MASCDVSERTILLAESGTEWRQVLDVSFLGCPDQLVEIDAIAISSRAPARRESSAKKKEHAAFGE